MDLDGLNERLVAQRKRALVMMRLDYLIRNAWYSIAAERGYRFDRAMNSVSHNVLVYRDLFNMRWM